MPEPIKAFGRFAHVALAVSPDRTRVYLSEDPSGPTGLFYRWTAPCGIRPGRGLARRLGPTAGTLEAMKIVLDDGSVPRHVLPAPVEHRGPAVRRPDLRRP